MSTRKNTIEIHFSLQERKPATLELHDWLVDDLQLKEDSVMAIQLNTMEHALYVKLSTTQTFEMLMNKYAGERVFQFQDGEKIMVRIVEASSSKIVRVFNLPPETEDAQLHHALASYGEIAAIRREKWSAAHRLLVENGVRAVTMEVKKAIPSSLIIQGHRAQITYDGQNKTCYRCQSANHLAIHCPNRLSPVPVNLNSTTAESSLQYSKLFSTVTKNKVKAQKEEQKIQNEKEEVRETNRHEEKTHGNKVATEEGKSHAIDEMEICQVLEQDNISQDIEKKLTSMVKMKTKEKKITKRLRSRKGDEESTDTDNELNARTEQD